MKYFKLLFIIPLLSLTFCKTAKNTSVKDCVEVTKCATIIPELSFKKENFPKDWIGDYQGDLQIYSVDSIQMTAKMNLHVSKKTDSIYNWNVTYNIKGKEDIRAYELQIIDTKKGHYIIDEKNSIKIDAFYKNKILTSFFKVMNNYIVATYTKENDSIVFEIIMASDQKTKITGNTKFEGEDIPKVITYFVKGRQKAVLKKQ